MVKKKILIATKQCIVATGLATILSSRIDQTILSYAYDDAEIFSGLQEHDSHVLVLDSEIVRNNNKNIIKELKAIKSSLKVVMYTSYQYDVTVYNIYKGADGFFNKYAKEADILSVINKVIRTRYSDSLQGNLSRNCQDCPLAALSERELQIFNLLIKGYTNLNISDILHLKMSTISTYKKRIFEKLEVNSIAELINLKYLL
ncbi:LuxR C-terminal-related transcriptional regulator [Elizabethkingia anophelis]|uniref:LuxR family transcriptional regulator n=1 Tax=Elizabethkingia anophelis TaxID=1117645 RepID=UPI003786FD2D